LEEYLPTALLEEKIAQPVGIISAVNEQHLAFSDFTQKFRCGLGVMSLAGRDGQLHWQAILVGQSMDFCSKTSPVSSKTVIWRAFFKVAAEWWTRALVPSIIRISPP
jgi:hypothetical protein